MVGPTEEERKDFIKTMYEQLWVGRMEGVKERLVLTTIFTTVLSACVIYVTRGEEGLDSASNLPWIVFMMLFSLFAVLFSLKVDGVLGAREKATNYIEKLYSLSKLQPKYDSISRWVKWINIGKIFPTLFFMFFCFLFFFLLRIVVQILRNPNKFQLEDNIIYAVVSGLIFLIFFLVLWRTNIETFLGMQKTGMSMREIKKMAKSLGLKITPKMKKLGIIKAIQRKQGKFDCFGTAVNYCDQEKCLFREDCLTGE